MLHLHLYHNDPRASEIFLIKLPSRTPHPHESKHRAPKNFLKDLIAVNLTEKIMLYQTLKVKGTIFGITS